MGIMNEKTSSLFIRVRNAAIENDCQIKIRDIRNIVQKILVHIQID